MRRIALFTTCAALVAVPAAAADVHVPIMVVGKTRTLVRPHTVTLRNSKVQIGHRRCSVPAGTALSGLLAARLRPRVTDAGGCDPASMFVTKVRSEANHGPAGWEYKVGHVSPSFGAADRGGKLRSNEQLLWFWCTSANACQRTLSVKAKFSGNVVTFHVTGYDDNGHGKPADGASVHVGSKTLTTNSHGSASATLPPGQYQAYATKKGMVRSFPIGVGVAT